MGSISEKIPKPLVLIGDKPVLWHIMKIYAAQGFSDFILCLGYKGEKVREYFEKNREDGWRISFVETGAESTKSERIKRVRDLIDGEDFFLAYGDDVTNIDLHRVLEFHRKAGSIITITAVRMPSQFGIVEIDGSSLVTRFREKPVLNEWINGGFMVVNREVFDYIHLGELESEVFEALAAQKKISAFIHIGEWKAMNTLKDSIELNELWETGKAFWKTW